MSYEQTENSGSRIQKLQWVFSRVLNASLTGGEEYSGGADLDFFIAHPATPEERDWASLESQTAPA